MAGLEAAVVFTDPGYQARAYDVASDPEVAKTGDFAERAGAPRRGDTKLFLANALAVAALHSRSGSTHFVCTDWRRLSDVLEAGREVYTGLSDVIVWAHDSGPSDTLYRSGHELLVAFSVGDTSEANGKSPRRRRRTNVWRHRPVNSALSSRPGRATESSLVKPVALIADAIQDVTRTTDIVLDPFGGSGSTLIAAEKTGRRAFLCEPDPTRCDQIISRWERFTGRHAVQIESEARCQIGPSEHSLQEAA
jgi:hypothetical protein